MPNTDYAANCPNCGAPIKHYGHCEYCGTLIHLPVQFVAYRPGIRKLTCVSQYPIDLGERDPGAVAAYAKRDIMAKMTDAISDSIKFLVRRDFDPRRFEEIISVRGELWISDPDVRY